MRWKYCLPASRSVPEERTALEDLYLVPEDRSSSGQSYWITVEGLRSFTGGTREEKLERLGDHEFVISDTLDMLVRREDFDKSELLGWTGVFIRARFGDPEPELVEATGAEMSDCTPVIHETELRARGAEKIRLLFVHHKSGAPAPSPEIVLSTHHRLDIRTVWVEERSATDLESDVFQWADLVLVMEKRMRQMIHRRLKNFGITKRVICLYLPEHHDRQDPDFTLLFKERVFVYLEKLGWKIA